MRWLISVCILGLFGSLSAEEVTASAAELEVQVVPIEIRDQSFFTDRVATAVVYFDAVVKAPEETILVTDTCNVVSIEVAETTDSVKGKSAALFRFLPLKTGIVTLPSLEFKSVEIVYQTAEQQIRVGEPLRSAEMSLSLQPQKLVVYAGEPLRLDLAWNCELPAAALRALSLNPSFFTDSAIEVVIPRNTSPEDIQVGLPIGGRRVIAERILNPEKGKQLGRIELPMYLRFKEAGHYTLPETRLDLSVLRKAGGDFGRYAAHFNNGFFEAVDAGEAYERVYATAPAIEIEVLPLPAEEQQASFSGLFAPIEIDISLKPTEARIGELMELEIKLTGRAPHGMLELPQLSLQPGLRERFIVDDNFGRLWHEEGTIFRTRVRALSTTIQGFPSLQFQVFDPETGRFTLQRTEAIPLELSPSVSGEAYLPLKSFEGAAVALTNQPEGIWHNMEANPMNDLLNSLFSFVRQAFWPLLILGPIAFACLLPLARERRRRALDERYRMRAEAYAAFRKLTGDSQAKWNAFLRFMALTFNSADKTWTQSDTQKELAEIGADDAMIEDLVAMHQSADAQDFSADGSQAKFKNLDTLAKQISQLAGKSALLFLLVVVILPRDAQANDFTDSERLFAQAEAEVPSSEAAIALYQDAALKAEAAARANSHPGVAWYNAGNAWFQAGYLGRAIVAYRSAQNLLPFDSRIIENLAAARAMALNDVPVEKSWWQKLPLTWLKVFVVFISFSFWALLLLQMRYRQRLILSAAIALGLILLAVSGLLIQRSVTFKQAGVVIVDAVYAKKGPSYAYANAFNEPLHDGLEFVLIEQRGDWGLIELIDTRQCWLPMSQLQLIEE